MFKFIRFFIYFIIFFYTFLTGYFIVEVYIEPLMNKEEKHNSLKEMPKLSEYLSIFKSKLSDK